MKTKSISEEFNNNGLIIENSKVSDSINNLSKKKNS